MVLTGFEPGWHHSDLPGEWFRSVLWHPSFRTSVAKLRADPETRCHREQSELFISMEGARLGREKCLDSGSAFGVASLVRNDGKVRRNSTHQKAHLEPSPGSLPHHRHPGQAKREPGSESHLRSGIPVVSSRSLALQFPIITLVGNPADTKKGR